jgi:hypothetical protein
MNWYFPDEDDERFLTFTHPPDSRRQMCSGIAQGVVHGAHGP